jgi:hypothetical protein
MSSCVTSPLAVALGVGGNSEGCRALLSIGAEELEDDAKSLAISGLVNPLLPHISLPIGPVDPTPSKDLDLRLSEFVLLMRGEGVPFDARVVTLR